MKKRSYTILPPWSPPWRRDLYQALFSALLVNPKADRGNGRAKELHNQALLICEKTGEELSAVVWALATLEAAMNQSSAAEAKDCIKMGSAPNSSPQKKASGYHDFLQKLPPIQPNLSPQLFR